MMYQEEKFRERLLAIIEKHDDVSDIMINSEKLADEIIELVKIQGLSDWAFGTHDMLFLIRQRDELKKTIKWCKKMQPNFTDEDLRKIFDETKLVKWLEKIKVIINAIDKKEMRYREIEKLREEAKKQRDHADELRANLLLKKLKK